MNSGVDFQINMVVFAKMKRFPYWPGLICEPPNELQNQKRSTASKPGMHWVRFFGSNDYSLVEARYLKLYADHKEELSKGAKTVPFRKALEEAEKYISDGCKFSDTNDAFDNLLLTSLDTSMPSTSLDTSMPSTSLDTSMPSTSKGIKGDAQTSSKKKDRRSFSGPLSKRSDVYLKENEAENSPGTSKIREYPLTSPRPESPPLNLETIAKDEIEPSVFKFGFIGIGKMGSGLIKNLTVTKHKIIVWNRTKKTDFETMGVSVAETPGDVVRDSDITFCCVSDNTAATEVAMGSHGALQHMRAGKSYVEMSGIDPSTSQTIADAVTASGGRYLEVRFQGSSAEAEEGSLILMAAGHRSLYDDCHSAFSAFSKQKTFLGGVGKASTIYLVLQSYLGAVMGALSEVMTMARNFQIPEDEVLDMFETMSIINPILLQKCRMALRGNITTQLSVKNLQKDLDMVQELANKLGIKVTELAITNEHLKACISKGYKDQDFASIFLV